MEKGKLYVSVFFLCFLIGPWAGLYAQNRQAVMIRGNTWRTENPGFGTGTITALSGEYRIDIQGSVRRENRSAFSVKVCGDPRLLDAEGWQFRQGGASLVQRRENGVLLIGFPFSGGAYLGSWTVIFYFPGANADSHTPIPVLDDVSINRLINAWIEHFRYFFSSVKVASDISLPAIVGF